MQHLAVDYRPLEALIPYARNARTHSPKQVAQIAASIEEFGFTNPVLVDGANGIIAGHGRVLAAGFEKGVRGKQLRLDRAIGTTTPDVIYRADHHDDDEGVCIYLDGLSRHIHGNAETAEQDRLIRSWLRNNGYEVIEIAVSDLDDKGAMVRHFRKLAGYLEQPELRQSVKDDRSWFERARQGT